MLSNRVSSVSLAPCVAMVYLRDCAGRKTKSCCCPTFRSTATDWKGWSSVASGTSPGYHLRIQSLSAFDRVPGGERPSASYPGGAAISPGSNSYSMIESGSHEEPCTTCGSSFSRMLWNVVSRDHLLGGAASEAYTASS